jgi:hypothetical protein
MKPDLSKVGLWSNYKGECDAWSVFSSLSDFDSNDGSALLSFEESD